LFPVEKSETMKTGKKKCCATYHFTIFSLQVRLSKRHIRLDSPSGKAGSPCLSLLNKWVTGEPLRAHLGFDSHVDVD
jgi:hypothetical protein